MFPPNKVIRFLLIISTSWAPMVMVTADNTAEFYYFSRETSKNLEKVEITEENLNLVNGSREIKFIIHGWGESSERPYYKDMTEEYLTNEYYDIIQVDWKFLAGRPYLAAAAHTKDVGGHIANLILHLFEAPSNSSSNPFDLVHLIGHSLGAHVAGHAGKAIRAQTGGQLLGRITGLDPAGPHFENAPLERLTAADATFVDITHTDANFFGINEPIGHVDFYPNGGFRPQPGCELFNPTIFKMSPQQIGFCSHTKSYQYFIDSINKEPTSAFRCESYVNFKKGSCTNNEQIVYGEHVDPNLKSPGKYYFDTVTVGALNAEIKQLNNKSSDILHNLIKFVEINGKQ